MANITKKYAHDATIAYELSEWKQVKLSPNPCANTHVTDEQVTHIINRAEYAVKYKKVPVFLKALRQLVHQKGVEASHLIHFLHQRKEDSVQRLLPWADSQFRIQLSTDIKRWCVFMVGGLSQAALYLAVRDNAQKLTGSKPFFSQHRPYRVKRHRQPVVLMNIKSADVVHYNEDSKRQRFENRCSQQKRLLKSFNKMVKPHKREGAGKLTGKDTYRRTKKTLTR